jgi:hypothetical protein
LRHGDPRQSRSFGGDSADFEQYAAGIRSRLATASTKPEEYSPLTLIQWRKDAAVAPNQKWTLIDSPALSASEEVMAKDRAALPSATLERTPKLLGIASPEDAAKAFEETKRAADCGDAVSLVAPFNKDRGAFVWIEKVVGLFPADAKKAQAPADRLYKVLVRVEDSYGFSKFHDFTAHCNFPTFLLDPIVFSNLPSDERLCLWITVFSVSTKQKQPNGTGGETSTSSDAESIVPLAWSVAKLFVGKQFLRHGRIAVPLFEGIAPPAEFVEEVGRSSLEETIVYFLSQEKIFYFSTRSFVVLAQGDVARIDEVTSRIEPAGSPKGGGGAAGAGPYAHRCKRKLVRRLNIPEFEAVEMNPLPGNSDPTMEKLVLPTLAATGETLTELQTRVNDRVTEYLKNGGLEEFRTGERKLQRSKSIFQRFFSS